MNLKAIRKGLAANAATVNDVPGSRVPLNTYPQLRMNVSSPAFAVGQAAIEFHQAFGGGGGLTKVTFECWVLIANGDDLASQERLDEYVGSGEAQALVVAIESDPTLGGACEGLIVQSIEQVTTTIGNQSWYAGRLKVEVYA